MAKRVTIQDIADALGLSRNTVSKAINNTGVLADATRDKILQKAIEMGYKQFSYVALAQGTAKASAGEVNPQPSLKTSGSSTPETDPAPVRHGNIALLTTLFLNNSHFSATMLDKMHRELSQLGYSISMHRILWEDIVQMKLPNSFVKEQTDAIVCIELFDEDYSNMVCSLGLPTLFIDYPATLPPSLAKSDRLLMDNRSGIFSFIQEMKNRGKTKLGFIGSYRHCMSFYERYSAFREGVDLCGLPFDRSYCLLEDEDKWNGDDLYREYLRESLSNMVKTGLPEVFICANDFVALDCLMIFRELNISVPGDVLLCGFDDSPESRIVTPPLTTIHIHSQIMGFSAVHLLMSRIKNPTINYRTIYTETTLIYRESTGD